MRVEMRACVLSLLFAGALGWVPTLSAADAAGVPPKSVAQATPAEFRAFYNSAPRCLSPDLKAKVDGQTVDVRACRVSAAS